MSRPSGPERLFWDVPQGHVGDAEPPDTDGSGPIVAMRTGRVTRQITRALVGTSTPMTTRELCAWAYPRLREICAPTSIRSAELRSALPIVSAGECREASFGG
jgi:hypothetical protein